MDGVLSTWPVEIVISQALLSDPELTHEHMNEVAGVAQLEVISGLNIRTLIY